IYSRRIYDVPIESCSNNIRSALHSRRWIINERSGKQFRKIPPTLLLCWREESGWFRDVVLLLLISKQEERSILAVIDFRHVDRTTNYSSVPVVLTIRSRDAQSVRKEVVCGATLVPIEVVDRSMQLVRTALQRDIHSRTCCEAVLCVEAISLYFEF